MTLQELIDKFVADNPWYSDSVGAYTMCCQASDDFVDFAHQHGHSYVKRYSFSLNSQCITGSTDHENPAPEIYGTKMSPRRNDDDKLICIWHCIVEAGDILIDFTAKQYRKSLPCPLIISKTKAAGAGARS